MMFRNMNNTAILNFVYFILTVCSISILTVIAQLTVKGLTAVSLHSCWMRAFCVESGEFWVTKKCPLAPFFQNKC